MTLNLPIPTILFSVAPRLFLDTEHDWSNFSLYVWSQNEYEWTEDPLGGSLDYVQRVETTLESDEGDCDDYARVVASALYATTERPLTLGIHYSTDSGEGHVTVYDGNHVFSSGKMHLTTHEEYMDDSEYNKHLTRTIR